MTSKIVYISGALSDVPDSIRQQYLDFYESIGKVVEECGLVAYIPHKNTDPVRHKDVTPGQVDLIDRSAVVSSALVIAVVDNPSLGVGIEVEMAFHANKPVILVFSQERMNQRKISRLVRGNPSVRLEAIYSDFEEALFLIKTYIVGFLAEQDLNILPSLLKVSAV